MHRLRNGKEEEVMIIMQATIEAEGLLRLPLGAARLQFVEYQTHSLNEMTA